MMPYPYAALFVGLALLIAATFVFLRHWLLHFSGKYPTAKRWLLGVIWVWALALSFGGLHFLQVFFYGAPDTIPPQPANTTQFLAFGFMFYEGSLFVNMLTQRLPRSQWDKSKVSRSALNG